jgi:aquaporin Z
VLLAIASGKSGFSAVESGFASNGYGDRSPGGYGLVAALITEIIMTAIFLYIILVLRMIVHRKVSHQLRSASA